MAKINKRFVDSVKAPERGDLKVYDDALSGFGLIVYASGKRSFFVEYGPKGHRRRMVLGSYGALTPEAARDLAIARLGEVAKGGDPLGDKEKRAAIPSFGAWADEYLTGVRLRKKQPRHDERYLSAAKERWRARPLDQVSRRDVQAAMAAEAERGPTTANRWLASVRACFAHAVKAGVIHENPAERIEAFREAPPRARVLTDEEYARVVQAFEAIADPHVRAAFVVLMDTGARKSEVLHAAWADIDLDGALWRIPSPKSGRPQVVPLMDSTIAVLRALPRVGPWLVPGRDAQHARTDLRRAWDGVREAAAVSEVTIHDLRRTFGLHVARKAGLHIASKLLRHSDIRVTERVYVPLGLDDTRAALADVQKARGEVIALRRTAK